MSFFQMVHIEFDMLCAYICNWYIVHINQDTCLTLFKPASGDMHIKFDELGFVSCLMVAVENTQSTIWAVVANPSSTKESFFTWVAKRWMNHDWRDDLHIFNSCWTRNIDINGSQSSAQCIMGRKNCCLTCEKKIFNDMERCFIYAHKHSW